MLYRLYLKRLFDIVLSCIAVIALSPVFAVIVFTIKSGSKGGVLFKQRRIGRHKKEFYIYKFRTMRADTPKDVPTHLLANPDIYITPIGKWLRKTSLDELPQLFNILAGDMSLIGPRPALWNQYDLIEKRDEYGANDVAVGLTGLAQIKGRDELPINIKAKFDGEYAQNISFLLDMKIFFITIIKTIKSDGVKEGGET